MSMAGTIWSKILFIRRPYDLEQTSIKHQKFTIKNLIQKGPQHLFAVNCWITKCSVPFTTRRSMLFLLMLLLLFCCCFFTLPSTTCLAVVISAYCTTVVCLQVLCCSCCCCRVVILNNLMLMWSALSQKMWWCDLKIFFIIIIIYQSVTETSYPGPAAPASVVVEGAEVGRWPQGFAKVDGLCRCSGARKMGPADKLASWFHSYLNDV